MSKLDIKTGDWVEVFIKKDGRSFTFKTEVIHQSPIMQVDEVFDAVIIEWDRGYEVTPHFTAQGWPQRLEGKKVYWVRPDPDYTQPGTDWGKVVRKVKGPQSVDQIHSHDPGGMHCATCNRMTQYASSNMSDGSFVCRDCRQTKAWKIPKNISFVGFEGERISDF